jgi:hypothetical protein
MLEQEPCIDLEEGVVMDDGEEGRPGFWKDDECSYEPSGDS